MIRSFRTKTTEAPFLGQSTKRFQPVARTAQRKLQQIHAAVELRDLTIFPGNRLEPLAGDRRGQHSLRVNGQFRICFVWRDGDAYDVEIVDDH